MRPFWIAFALIAFCVTPRAEAADVQTILTQRLQGYYDAQKAGDIDKALGFFAKEQQKLFRGEIGDDPDKRKMASDWMQKTAPKSFTVQKVTEDKAAHTASLYTVNEMLDDEGKLAHVEMQTDFVKEGSVWAITGTIFGMNLDAIKRANNDDPEPADAYDDSTSLNIGGPIRRVAFEKDYTLIVIRVLDEEHDLFLPPKAKLKAMGIDPAKLTEGTIVSGDGATSRNDEFKH
ncbi:MAG: hypothetical protein ACREFM_14015, partial [Hypericibacter sp.]